MKYLSRMKTLGLALVTTCSLLISGCGSIPEKNSKLDAAHAIYEQAKAMPEMATSPQAQVYLLDANGALTKAQQAETVEEREHQAYLAKQLAKTAMAIAKRKSAEKEAEKLGKAVGEVRLDMRDKAIHQAESDAEASAQEAAEQSRQARLAIGQANLAQEQTEQAHEQIEELQKQLANLNTQKTDRGLVITLGDVLFATGQADLLAGAQHNIDKLAEFLNKNPQRKIMIEGHTDSRGSDAMNQRLSENRAHSVRNNLLSTGVSMDRMTTQGFSESKPIASNNNATGRQQNRRVEVIILND